MSERGIWTSASNARADNLCPGRHLAQAGLIEPPSSDDAERGSRIHDALARNEMPMKLSLEERETFDACREIEKKLVIDYFGEQPPAPIKVSRETRLWVKFSKDGREYQHSGKPDVVFRSGTKAILCEYKTGRLESPESPGNLQLRDQAVLVRGNLALLDEIATAVIQPLVTHDSQITVYDRDALDRATIEMYERVIASNQPNAPRIAGEVQCEFCLAKTRCTAYTAWATQAVPTRILVALDVPMVSWTPQQRAAAASAIGPAVKFIEELKDFIKGGLEKDPEFCPGWTLRPGNKIETITDPQACFDRLATLGGKLEDFLPCVKVGKTKLKETVNKITGAKGKALEKTMAELTQGIVAVTQNAPSLKPIKEDGQ